MLLEPGTALGERYRLVKPLAKGGMATVWAADDSERDERVAIKFLAKDMAEEGDIRARFLREASAKLDSPYIVQLYDQGITDDDTPFIVMELLEGEDLGERLDRDGRLPLSAIGDILDEMAQALEVAHAAGIVHRDIKPANIFLVRKPDGSEHIKLLDFGIAKHTAIQTYSVVTETGTMLGTPGYMSPEQVLTGSRIDWRSDLWSVGVVAYHAMTGEVPFDGATLGALCVAITRGRYLAPCDRVAALPGSLDAWMARVLAVEPDERFGSAAELAESFRKAAAGVAPEPSRSALGRSDTVRDAISVAEGRRQERPQRWWVFALVALGAALLGGLVVAQVMPPDRNAAGGEPPTASAIASAHTNGTSEPSAASALSAASTLSEVTPEASSSTTPNAAPAVSSAPTAMQSASGPPPAPNPQPSWVSPPKPTASPTAVPTVKDRGF